MALKEELFRLVKEKGWLAFSTLYFDNTATCNIYRTDGKVAISESKNCAYWFGCRDIIDSACIEDKYVSMNNDTNNRKLSHQMSLIMEDLDCLQHADTVVQRNALVSSVSIIFKLKYRYLGRKKSWVENF